MFSKLVGVLADKISVYKHFIFLVSPIGNHIDYPDKTDVLIKQMS